MRKQSEVDPLNRLGKTGFSRGRMKLGRGQGGPISRVPLAKPLSLHTHYEAGSVFPGDVIFKALFPIECVISDVAILVSGDSAFEGDVSIRLTILSSEGETSRVRKVTRDTIASFNEGINLDRGDIITLSLDNDSVQVGDVLISFVARAGIG